MIRGCRCCRCRCFINSKKFIYFDCAVRFIKLKDKSLFELLKKNKSNNNERSKKLTRSQRLHLFDPIFEVDIDEDDFVEDIEDIYENDVAENNVHRSLNILN